MSIAPAPGSRVLQRPRHTGFSTPFPGSRPLRNVKIGAACAAFTCAACGNATSEFLFARLARNLRLLAAIN